MKTQFITIVFILVTSCFTLFSQNFIYSSTVYFEDGFPGSFSNTKIIKIENNTNKSYFVTAEETPYFASFNQQTIQIYGNSYANFYAKVKYPIGIQPYSGTVKFTYRNEYDSGVVGWVNMSFYTIKPIPSSPINLNANNIGSNSITVSWNKSNYTQGSLDYADGYKIYVNNILHSTASSTSHIITGLQSNSIYNISVSAYNNKGESNKTNKTINTLISQPTGVSVTRKSQRIYHLSCDYPYPSEVTSVQVSFGPSAYILTNGKADIDIDPNDINKILGFYSMDNLQRKSSLVTWNINTQPAMPEAPYDLRFGNQTDHSITLNWDTYDFYDYFIIKVSGSSGGAGNFISNNNSFQLNNLNPGDYQIRIYAYKDGVGESKELYRNLRIIPIAPQNLRIIKTPEDTWRLVWDPLPYNYLHYLVRYGQYTIINRGRENYYDITQSLGTVLGVYVMTYGGESPVASILFNPSMMRAKKNENNDSNNLDENIDNNTQGVVYYDKNNFLYLNKIMQGVLKIYDVRGIEVLRSDINNEKIDISHLKTGIYIVNIDSVEHKYQFKIIKR